MVTNRRWTRNELLAALNMYCQLPFGRLHASNPAIIQLAHAMGRSPSALAMKLVNIASLDPKITSTGRSGLQNASSQDRQMWAEMQDDWERFAVEAERATAELGLGEESTEDQTREDSSSYVGEDRPIETTARIGQRFFRMAVLSAYNGRCCITGLSFPSLLVASHIVPWSHDRDNRVNPRNGLLLSALHDKAFDSGILTINDDMTVRVSSNILARADRFFSESISSYNGYPITLPQKFEPDRGFLRYHRENIYVGD
ncbi:MAG: HNH endonuclease [Chloroflexi bacterium]|nr:HNH endonuclease [Chloroflexota bacterium]MYK35835.1 HNH endonuclease [Chloroflexota bacterium]